MSCAPSEGWYGVRADVRDEDDLSMLGARVTGRCVIYSAAGVPCAEGLVLRFDQTNEQLAVYWNKATRAFQTMPVRPRP